MKPCLRSHRLADIDRLLGGRTPHDEGLCDLLPLVRTLRNTAAATPSASRASLVAQRAALLAPAAQARPFAETQAKARRECLSPARLRLAGALLALLFMLSASAGVAAASDNAIPGDTLYPLDCALEDIGLDHGGMAERLSEANLLTRHGRLAPGLELVAAALHRYAPANAKASRAAEDLLAAADVIAKHGNSRPVRLERRVADTLLELAASGLGDDRLDQAVATLALDLTADGDGNPSSPHDSNGRGRGNQGSPANDKDKTTTTKIKQK